MKQKFDPDCHQQYLSLVQSLSAYEKAGIRLTLSGRPSNPRELAYVCTVRESEAYMSDFIPDSRGNLKEIRFDKVKDL